MEASPPCRQSSRRDFLFELMYLVGIGKISTDEAVKALRER